MRKRVAPHDERQSRPPGRAAFARVEIVALVLILLRRGVSVGPQAELMELATNLLDSAGG